MAGHMSFHHGLKTGMDAINILQELLSGEI